MALLKEFEDKDVTCTSHYEVDKWVVLKKPYKSALTSFHEFERHFARLSDGDRRLVGVNKVLSSSESKVSHGFQHSL